MVFACVRAWTFSLAGFACVDGMGRYVGGRALTWRLNLARLLRLGAAFRTSSLFCLHAWGQLVFASVRAWGLRGGGGPP